MGAKCHHEEPKCFSTVITRIQRPCSASILPPYAAPLLGRSLSGSQLSRKRASSLPPLPLLGKPTAWLYPAAIPPHLCRGEPRQKCSGQPGGSRSGCWRCVCPSEPATPSAGGVVPGSIRCRERFPFVRARGPFRPRPVRPSANRTMPVFVGVWEPEVSQPLRRQSPPTPSRQTASPASLRFAPAPWSLGDSKPGFPHQGRGDIDRRSPPDRPALETPSNQGPPRDSRLSLGADASVVPRPGDGKRVNTYTTGGSGWRRCWSYYPLSSL